MLLAATNCTVGVACAPLAPARDKKATLTITTDAGGPYTVTAGGSATRQQ